VFIFFISFCLDTKERKGQGCIKNSSLHLQNPRKWNDFRAQLSTFPFSKGFAALLLLFFLRPGRFYLARVGWVVVEWLKRVVAQRVINIFMGWMCFCIVILFIFGVMMSSS
jgi:hypothetical protein